jgi:hypothetical protein
VNDQIMDDEDRYLSSPPSMVNGHTRHYEIPLPDVAEPTTSNGDLASTDRKLRADSSDSSDSESSHSTTSELSSDNEGADELHQYIYFDDAGDRAPIVNQASSRQHEIQTAPLFTNSALECMKRRAKVNGIHTRIHEY